MLAFGLGLKQGLLPSIAGPLLTRGLRWSAIELGAADDGPWDDPRRRDHTVREWVGYVLPAVEPERFRHRLRSPQEIALICPPTAARLLLALGVLLLLTSVPLMPGIGPAFACAGLASLAAAACLARRRSK